MASIYIHIPFCKHICSYCDFAKIYYDKSFVNKYLDALKKEIDKYYKREEVNTIYIGGGTPSLLKIDELNKLFSIIKVFKLNNPEFTFECNIEDINDDLLSILKNNGVNRLSIGIESTNDEILKFLNRPYNKDDIDRGITVAKKYFDNISVDLMYAIPGETIKDLESDIDTILKYDVPHISTYSLIIEPHTKIYNDGIKNIDEELDRLMYDLICSKLSSYNHYEVSNFGKNGYESKHNLVYWNNKKYYGFGLGAGGYIDDTRYLNTRNINDYIKGNYRLEENILSINEVIENEFILGLRKLKGINKVDFKNKYNIDINNIDIVKKLISENKLIDDGEYIKIKEDLIYVSNSILVNFIGVDYNG